MRPLALPPTALDPLASVDRPSHPPLQLELRAREDQLAQVRAWLDEAQQELVTTQAALQEREGECRRVTAQLHALQQQQQQASMQQVRALDTPPPMLPLRC